MTDEIYSAIEVNNEVNVNINLQNEVTNNRNESRNTLKDSVKKDSIKETRSESRQFRNRNLRDLIQILLIRELIKRNRNKFNQQFLRRNECIWNEFCKNTN